MAEIYLALIVQLEYIILNILMSNECIPIVEDSDYAI